MSFVRSRSATPILLGLGLFCAGCSSQPYAQVEIGAPLPGLSAAELERFRQGEAIFAHVFTPEEGLGPLFNENACNACHTDPANGGTGEQFLIRATRFIAPDSCDLLSHEGAGNIQQQATPLLQAHGITRKPMPPSATEQGRFGVTFLFGLGLVEAIPEEAILARADPDDADGDGISGRAGRALDGRLGRFGRKANSPTLLHFVETALLFEMGLTTPNQPFEETLGGHPLPPGADPVPDPEVDQRTVEMLRDFVRFLAPPQRRVAPTDEERQVVSRGERLFAEVGCASCHLPSIRTGPSEIQVLNRKTVHLYSDLLLHDLGPQMANVCGVAATPTELRTAMLMGLGHRRAFLHDSRALGLREAIEFHGGEAAAARAAFRGLSAGAQEALLRFLESL
ncbi:MAG: di-heme oxidoredictase family protein [Longimicrobiaceae bacterium]